MGGTQASDDVVMGSILGRTSAVERDPTEIFPSSSFPPWKWRLFYQRKGRGGYNPPPDLLPLVP